MTFLIRSIEETDWSAIDAMQYRVYEPSLHEDIAVLRSKWLASPLTCFVAENAQKHVAAYLLTHPWISDDPPALNAEIPSSSAKNLFIHDLSVDTSAQGHGLGAKMFNQLLETCKEFAFEQIRLVAVQNSAPFWRRYGFETAMKLPESKGYGDNAVLMVRSL